MLVESINPTWLYATASEHAALYQFNFYGAEYVFGGLLQTESPYYQPSPKAPTPFESVLGVFDSDPQYDCGSSEFDGCDSSWAFVVRWCQNMRLVGMGVYSWFSDYTQDCSK